MDLWRVKTARNYELMHLADEKKKKKKEERKIETDARAEPQPVPVMMIGAPPVTSSRSFSDWNLKTTLFFGISDGAMASASSYRIDATCRIPNSSNQQRRRITSRVARIAAFKSAFRVN